MFDSWLQDVRYAARLLRRSPLFAVTATLSLAIGIGANTTIFTVATALLNRTPVICRWLATRPRRRVSSRAISFSACAICRASSRPR